MTPADAAPQSAATAAWTMETAPYQPAILPAPVRAALTAAATPADADATPSDEDVVADPRRFTVAHGGTGAATSTPTPPAPGAAPSAVPSPQPAAAAVATAPIDLRDPRVDTAELQRIWDLGEAPSAGPVPARRGRHAAPAPVDAKPVRAPRADSPRRRARHRA